MSWLNMIEFKYFADYERLVGLNETPSECSICHEQKHCLGGGLYGTDRIERVCATCLANHCLFGRDIQSNNGNRRQLSEQLRTLNPSASEVQLKQIADTRTRELEQTTPHLITWQDMDWPCLDGDYAQFIGYGSKPLLTSMDHGNDGKAALQRFIHPELKSTIDDEFWRDMVPDKVINDFSDTEQYGTLLYVFRSLTDSVNFVIMWDCN